MNNALAILESGGQDNKLTAAIGREAAGQIMAGLVGLVAGNYALRNCSIDSLLSVGLDVHSLGLSLQKQAGHVAIIPRKGEATMQVQWRGWLQMARNGGGIVDFDAQLYTEGEIKKFDRRMRVIQFDDAVEPRQYVPPRQTPKTLWEAVNALKSQGFVGAWCYVTTRHRVRKWHAVTIDECINHAWKFASSNLPAKLDDTKYGNSEASNSFYVKFLDAMVKKYCVLRLKSAGAFDIPASFERVANKYTDENDAEAIDGEIMPEPDFAGENVTSEDYGLTRTEQNAKTYIAQTTLEQRRQSAAAVFGDEQEQAQPEQQPVAITVTNEKYLAACEVKGSDGVRYGDRRDDQLEWVMKNPKSPADKREAAQAILYWRKNNPQ